MENMSIQDEYQESIGGSTRINRMEDWLEGIGRPIPQDSGTVLTYSQSRQNVVRTTRGSPAIPG
jgi:hypothetical protein